MAKTECVRPGKFCPMRCVHQGQAFIPISLCLESFGGEGQVALTDFWNKEKRKGKAKFIVNRL